MNWVAVHTGKKHIGKKNNLVVLNDSNERRSTQQSPAPHWQDNDLKDNDHKDNNHRGNN